MTGSHCDAIPLAGLYDGTLGVIGGAAAVKALRQAGYQPSKTIEVIMFTSEEPTRFGLGCIGRYCLPLYTVHTQLLDDVFGASIILGLLSNDAADCLLRRHCLFRCCGVSNHVMGSQRIKPPPPPPPPSFPPPPAPRGRECWGPDREFC